MYKEIHANVFVHRLFNWAKHCDSGDSVSLCAEQPEIEKGCADNSLDEPTTSTAVQQIEEVAVRVVQDQRDELERSGN